MPGWVGWAARLAQPPAASQARKAASVCPSAPCPAPTPAGSYCVYAALNAGAAAFLASRMVETKGLPVDRIRALLMGEGERGQEEAAAREGGQEGR